MYFVVNILIVDSLRKPPLKSALHHWWPRSLSRFWADDTGIARQLWWNGREVTSRPETFGAIKNAHHIKLRDEGTVWDMSFEQAFSRADSQFPGLVDWLGTLESKTVDASAPLVARLCAQPLPIERKKQLSECLASLIVRSPYSRNMIKLTAEYGQQALGLRAGVSKALIAANMRGCQEAFAKAMNGGGKFAVLSAHTKEFIFGEGFLHNFPSFATTVFSPRCIVPVTPTITLIYLRPVSYRSPPELVTIRLSDDEIEFFNDTIQVYSKDFIFYRNKKPSVIPAFGQREFLQYQYNDTAWLGYFLSEIAHFSPTLA